MHLLIPVPFIVQALCIAFDEYYFHIKRGLPLWKRIGHPIDTLSVLAYFSFIKSFTGISYGKKKLKHNK